jgi:hypothetical protein
MRSLAAAVGSADMAITVTEAAPLIQTDNGTNSYRPLEFVLVSCVVPFELSIRVTCALGIKALLGSNH